MILQRPEAARRNQSGAATLVVVMMLFLIMALLAAYANRSLMFEQRMSGGYYRASMAQEVAEGGFDWTLAMLNGTAIDANCQPVASGGVRFADKYLNVSPADRGIRSISTAPASTLAVDCARTDTTLVCRCPAPDKRTAQPTTANSGSLIPSFGMSLGVDPKMRYGLFKVASRACTDSSIDNCANTEARSQQAIATAAQWASIALVSAVRSSPASPLTVKGSLKTLGAGALGLHNTDPTSAGILVVSGGPAPALMDSHMDSVPGTPASQARLFDQDQLKNLSAAGFFRLYMGMSPDRYKNHPSLRKVKCGAGDCAAALQAAYDAGTRILWVEGAMHIASNLSLGTINDPALIVVNGNATLDGPMQITGMVVITGDLDWTNTGGLTSLVTGFVVVQGGMSATGGMDIQYSQLVANQLRNRIGSYVRVSGGWIDGDSR